MEVLYQLLTVVVLAAGCLSGIRRGVTGQLGSLIGAVFGIGAVGLLYRDVALWIAHTWPWTASELPMTMFLPTALACALTYCGVYLLLLTLSPALRIIMAPLGRGPLNKVCGAVWGVAKWTILLSLLFNVLIGLDHRSALMKAASHNDGNLATAVMWAAPALMGTTDCDELVYRIQLMEAEQFDRNHKRRPGVE